MPRMQVYLPDAMYVQVKERGLPVSELLQRAVEAELRRLDLLAETDRYLKELTDDVGHPNAPQRTRAEVIARRISKRSVRKVG
jgi:post-segregation antitoxin (ccd killing protein)